MSTYSEASTRRLPRGWAHLVLQFAIWIGFYVVYQVARGAADQSVTRAFENGQWVIDFQRSLHSMIELPLQHLVESSSVLIQATSYTYWLSQFAVVGNRAALRLLPRARALHPLPEHADRREPDRPRRLCDAADRAAADVPAGRLQRHARPARCPDARLEPDPVLGEPLRGDAEPPLGRRSDRRGDDGARRALDVGEGALARVAGVGLVQRDGDGQPLLARHRRRDRGRRRRGGGRLPAVAASLRAA